METNFYGKYVTTVKKQQTTSRCYSSSGSAKTRTVASMTYTTKTTCLVNQQQEQQVNHLEDSTKDIFRRNNNSTNNRTTTTTTTTTTTCNSNIDSQEEEIVLPPPRNKHRERNGSANVSHKQPLGSLNVKSSACNGGDIGTIESTQEASRSQPAIGLKQASKARPTIFGTLASEQSPKEIQTSLPQTPKSAKLTTSSPSYKSMDGCCNGTTVVDGINGQTTDDSHTLVFHDGNLTSGSVEALIRHLVPTANYYPDRTYLFAFLLSSRLFIKPHELLQRVCNVCAQQQNLLQDHINKDSLGNFCPNLIQLLSEWAETFPYDFRDDRLMKQMKKLTQRCIQIDNRLRKEVNQMVQNLLHKLNKLEKYEEFLSTVNTAAANRLINHVAVTDINEVCPSPNTLAQQLTHIELERLSNIGPEEFVQAFAKENPHVETSFRDMKKTKNLESYIQWFNRLSYFVATEVCMHPKKKHRAKVIEYFIEAARECFNLGNFNSLMAIIAGMNMSPVSRLKKTWAKVNTAKFDILEHQMDPTSNFTSYRSTLKAAMWRSQGAMEDREKIVIPFFSLLVKDLYFLNEGCANKLPNGHINLEKFWQLAKQVTEFMTWQQVSCPFEKHPKVLNYLLTNPVFSESALALASFECEQPENNTEKERYKTLKSELST